MPTRGIMAAALMAGLTVGAAGGELLRTPRLLSEHVVDCSSVEAILAGILRPGMTQRDKAEAIYRFVRDYRYHWPPGREGERWDDYEYGVVYDPIRILNVYGYGYCFQTGPVLEALYEAAGLEARCVGLTGHTVAEAFYDGGYHYYDAELLSFFRLLDGRTVASVDQCSRDPIRLIVHQPNPSDPYLPTSVRPLVPYESKVVLAGYLANRPKHHCRYDKIRLGHRMDVTLAPGMRYVRNFEPEGKWNYRPTDVEMECKLGYIDPAVGPKSLLDSARYGNGYLLYQPDLTSRTTEYKAGVWSERNISQDQAGLKPAQPDRPAHAVFRIRLPYLIVGWPTQWSGQARPVGAAVVSARFHRGPADQGQAISVSNDGGQTWTTIWRNEQVGAARAVVDLSEQVANRYEYLVRFELASGGRSSPDCRLSELAIRTSFQCSPRSLPAVGPGRTRMTFSLADQTETTELTADLVTAEGFVRDLYAMRAIRFQKGRLTSLDGQTGEVIYRLQPPHPGTIREVIANAGCRREPHQLNFQDDVKIYYAENEPTDWKLLADDDPPPYMQHWSYELNGRAACQGPVRCVFVKFALRTAANASIQNVRLLFRWLPADGATGVPPRGARIVHAWSEGEDAAEKTFATVVRESPAEYVVQAGPKVANRYVLIEPVRDDSCRWRDDDPPITQPTVEPPRLVDPAVRDEMCRSLLAVEADPAKALPAAAASRIEWLATAARISLEMYRNRERYPLADPADAGPGGLLAVIGELNQTGRLPVREDADKLRAVFDNSAGQPVRAYLAAVLVLLEAPQGRAATTAVLADPDTFLKVRFVELLAGEARPKGGTLPDELLDGLRDESRWVRLAVLKALRAGGLSPAARQALERTANDDLLAFLRAEAASVLAAHDARPAGNGP